MFFFNVWDSNLYSIEFILIIIFLVTSITIISYIITKAIFEGIKKYQKKQEILNKILSINEKNVREILEQLNLNSSYKLKIKNISNINELKNLLLKKYYEK